MKTQKSAPLAQSDSKRLQRFMMAAPAAVAAVGGASITKADAGGVVYFDIPDQAFTLNSPQFNVGNINLTGGGSYDHTTGGSYFAVRYTSTEKPRVNSANSTVDFLRDTSIYGEGLQFLSAGATIDSSSATWGTYFGYFDSNFAATGTSWQNANQTGYIGIRINLGSSNYNYGWAGFSYDDAGNLLTFTDFAFESATNTAITAGAGAIPEPANSALLLAAGAAGVLAFRRRKREQAA